MVYESAGRTCASRLLPVPFHLRGWPPPPPPPPPPPLALLLPAPPPAPPPAACRSPPSSELRLTCVTQPDNNRPQLTQSDSSFTSQQQAVGVTHACRSLVLHHTARPLSTSARPSLSSHRRPVSPTLTLLLFLLMKSSAPPRLALVSLWLSAYDQPMNGVRGQGSQLMRPLLFNPHLLAPLALLRLCLSPPWCPPCHHESSV